MRKVLSVTGIRSEYDAIYPVLKAIDEHPDLELKICVTGAHLSERFGMTVNLIKADGFAIADEVQNLIDGNTKGAQVRGAAMQLLGLTQCIEREKPDFLLVVGDREEVLTSAIAGAYMYIPTVHVSGGDKIVGCVDDQVRHATTKLAHIHFATNKYSAERIIRLGEEPFRVFNVGSPALDRFLEIPPMDKAALFEWYGFPPEWLSKPLLMLIQHVVSSESTQGYQQMKTTLEAIQYLGWPTVLSYPNSDAGSGELIRCIEEYKDMACLRIFKNIPRHEFVNTLRHAACLVGNSSLGIIEAPFLKLPVVNIGNRQNDRLHGDNVVFVPHDFQAILDAVRHCVSDKDFLKEVAKGYDLYGTGHASSKIADILATIPIDNRLLIKQITY